ncbi:zinc-finger domain-containing protein [Legionella sp. km772]|uniref:zinc-finger domain-containing protein n=1 Tax=Legionella sp. km772 TaxID=2498111 RepID=UPI000F8E8234|nr:zinc-finger domain-containing protein [Legionella sp. km772]RUR12546.1 zinc-finger domain-containing protein [Legionella sp. km772]
MLTENKEPASAKKNYVVHRSELPLSCPTDSMELWNAHPKVYLPIEKTGVEVCPYCGSRFVLQND